MSTPRFSRRFWILLATPTLLASCIPSGFLTPTPSAAPKPIISRDIGKLGQSIDLPRRPQNAIWQWKQLGASGFGPSDYTIKALMQFSTRDLQALTSSASKRAKSQPAIIAVEPWFPDALKKQAEQNKNSLRAQKLDPSDFYKMSFIHGDLWRIEGTSYLFASLFTN